jgi:hypothetical protein
MVQGLFLLYFIGKNYADLAGQFNKQKWVYVIIGIAFAILNPAYV